MWQMYFIGISEWVGFFGAFLTILGAGLTAYKAVESYNKAIPSNRSTNAVLVYEHAYSRRTKPTYDRISDDAVNFVKGLSPTKEASVIRALSMMLLTRSPVQPTDVVFQSVVSETQAFLFMPLTGPWGGGSYTTHEDVETLIDAGLVRETPLRVLSTAFNKPFYFQNKSIRFNFANPTELVFYKATPLARELMLLWGDRLLEIANCLMRLNTYVFKGATTILIGNPIFEMRNGALYESLQDEKVFVDPLQPKPAP